jgi:hypothetical protein
MGKSLSDGGDNLCGPDLAYYPVSKVKSWIVAYSTTGEILDSEALFDPLPSVVKPISANPAVRIPSFTKEALQAGERLVEIQFATSPTHPERHTHFATRLTNRSDDKIRCLAFAAYRSRGTVFTLTTVTGTIFSSEQFAEWYAVRRGGWIEPGESICDPSNYGENCWWVYYFETERGKHFHVGKKHKSHSRLRSFISRIRLR